MWQATTTMKTAVTIEALTVATIVASPSTNKVGSLEQAQHRDSDGRQTCWYDPDLPRCE